MARKQEPIKPFYTARHDFEASLKAYVGEVLMLASAVETALDLGEFKPAIAKLLRERLDALNAVCRSPDE